QDPTGQVRVEPIPNPCGPRVETSADPWHVRRTAGATGHPTRRRSDVVPELRAVTPEWCDTGPYERHGSDHVLHLVDSRGRSERLACNIPPVAPHSQQQHSMAGLRN